MKGDGSEEALEQLAILVGAEHVDDVAEKLKVSHDDMTRHDGSLASARTDSMEVPLRNECGTAYHGHTEYFLCS